MAVPRGRLKVYVGMAAGVGKTYAMLEEGHERLRAGERVAIGWVEPHGRPETLAMSEGLPTIAPRVVEHRGLRLPDLDVAAVLAARPDVVLVDELAHTNPSDPVHERRWQDVAELLDAGISVISTVNVQHIESLNDRVFELTGVRVRETIPDHLLLDADELVLVDLTPSTLRERLQAGKIYPVERVDAALMNFFTRDNLAALREIALREVAGAIDAQLARTTPGPRVELRGASAEISERVLAIAHPRPGAQRLIRIAWRTARRLQAELDVVCPVGRLDESSTCQRDLARELSATLGAHFRSVADADLVDTVVTLVRERGVTRLAMPVPHRRGMIGRLRGDLLGTFLARIDGVDYLLIADRGASGAGHDGGDGR